MIKNIVFDLGGVIITLDFEQAVRRFYRRVKGNRTYGNACQYEQPMQPFHLEAGIGFLGKHNNPYPCHQGEEQRN